MDDGFSLHVDPIIQHRIPIISFSPFIPFSLFFSNALYYDINDLLFVKNRLGKFGLKSVNDRSWNFSEYP